MTSDPFDPEVLAKARLVMPERWHENGTSSVLVRQTGAVIRELKLKNVTVLTTGTKLDLSVAEQPMKIDATHTMLPVGPSAVGPQHGMSRYLDYEILESGEGMVRLHAVDPLRNLGHTKEIEVQDDKAVITDRVENLAGSETGISLGEHCYFKILEGDVPKVVFVEADGSDTVLHGHDLGGAGFDGVYADAVAIISEGGTVHVENFSGSQLIDIPGTGRVRLAASAVGASGDAMKVDLYMWHRPGSDTVAFEPVVGFSQDVRGAHNNGIRLRSGERVELKTEISFVIVNDASLD